MASLFLTPLDLTNFTNTPLSSTANGFVKVYVKNSYLTYLLPSGVENDVVLSRPLDGLAIPTFAIGIISSDSLIIALSKLQASLNNIVLTGDVTGTASYISGLLTINATLTTSGLTPTNIANWNTAYSWGNHATAGYQLVSQKGLANGYASLDSMGKVPISQLPSSIMEYKGMWNATTNFPSLTNGLGDTGDVYVCNVAGTVNFGAGPITFTVGDYVIYSGSIWQRSSGAVGTVTSVGISVTGNAIGVSNSPVTTSGTLALAFAGNSTQYINGAGNLVSFPSIVGQAQNLITEVYNRTGATLTKGTIVYINGGQGNLPTVTRAIATSDPTSAQTYGMVQQDITNMNNGFVVVAGRLSDIDTQVYLEGTQLYLSPTTAGTWTSTKPHAPAHLVYVGIVVRSHPTHGIIEVNIQNGYEMDELHNVSAQNPNNNDILQYKTATNLWTKVAGTTSNIAEGTNLYFTDARGRTAISLTTTGTSGVATYDNLTGILNIPNYATASLTVGTSPISSGTVGRILFEGTGNVLQQSANLFWDQVNSRLSVGTVTATAKLHVKGDSDSVGNSFIVDSLSQNRLIIGNDGKHAINGSVSAADNLYITGDLGFTYSRADNANFFKVNSATAYSFDIQSSTFFNANGASLGIIRFSNGTAAYRFRSDIGYVGLYFGSSGSSGIGRSHSISGGTFISGVHSFGSIDEPFQGAIDLQASGTAVANSPIGIHMHITLPNTSFPALYRAANIRGNFNISSGANGAVMLNIDPTYNQTGGTATFTGINYNPTLTSILGAHYGFLIRPATLNGIGLGSTLPTATLHIRGAATSVGNALQVQNLTDTPRLVVGNDGYHAFNTTTVGTTALTVDHPYPTSGNFFIVDFKQTGSATRFTLDTDGRLAWVAGKFATYDNVPNIATISNPAQTTTGIAVSAAGSIKFFSNGREGRIGRKFNYDAGKLYYFAGANGGGAAGTAFHLFESDYGLANAPEYRSQFMQLNPPGVTGIGTGTNISFKFLDIKTSSTIDLDNPNTLLFGIDYNPTITAYNGAHYGILVRPTTLNGFGLGATLPTSTLQVKGSATTTGSSLLVQNSSNFTNLEVLNSSQSSVKIGVNNITTEITGGSSSATDYILRVLRSGNGLSIRQQNGVPPLTTIEATNNLEIVSLDNSYIAIGNQLLLRSEVLVADQTYSALATGYGFALGSGRSGIRFGDSLSGGVGFKVPYLMQVVGNNRSEAGDLKINPFGGNVGIGLTNSYLVVPTATLHVKGNSNTTGNVFIAENLSNTANLTLANNGISTFNFSTGGKVLIAGAVGSGETLLEIRRTNSSSGGFIFRSGNALSQELWTTNGNMYLGTPDGSSIFMQPTTGNIIMQTALRNMTAFNSGYQVQIGTQGASVLNRWLNFGHNSSYGQVIQAVQNGNTPAVDTLSLNPFGSNVGIGAILPTALLHIKSNSTSTGNVFVAENLTNEVIRLQNDRDIVIGGGTASTDTQVTINAFRAAGTSNYVFRVNADANNYMRFINSIGNTTGGLYISRDSASIGRYALSVGGAGGTSFVLTSNGSIGINTATAGSILPAEVYNNGIINSNVAGKNGQYFLTAGSNRGFTFEHLGTGSFNTGQAVFQISKSLTDSGPGIGLDKLFEINGTYDFTGTAKGIIGINYNMTITALSGAHYGMLIRPATLNGIGLGSTLPTAQLHIAAGTATANTAPIKLNTGTALTTPEDGALEYHSSHLYFTIGSTRYQLDQQSGGGGGSGTVTSVSIVTANGFAGTVATNTTTPAITLTTTITGILKGNGTSVSAAVAGTDFQGVSTNLTSLAGLSYASTSFVKMTAAGTFDLDTNTYYLASNPNGYTTNVGTVTSVAALTLGTSGTDVSSTVANGTTVPVITLNLPTASAINRGALSSSDWTTFNNKQKVITSGTAAPSGGSDGDIYLQYT
jgi:hypothetical protein